MEEKNKLFVFEKKEVALIFLFMILIAVTSFVFGVKVGKGYSYSLSGLTQEDRTQVEMLSEQEEAVKANVEQEHVAPKEEHLTEDMTYKKLQEEFSKLDSESNKVEEIKAAPKVEEKVSAEMNEEMPTAKTEKSKAPKDNYTGKYTIQLGSHRSVKEAEEFANGFKIRGYNPIINEVEISGKGLWYRVSLGVFNTVSDAKDYISKEKSLFQGQDYVIGKFD